MACGGACKHSPNTGAVQQHSAQGLVGELGGNLGRKPEPEFVDAEVAEVSEYRVTGNDITVGRVSPSPVKG